MLEEIGALIGRVCLLSAMFEQVLSTSNTAYAIFEPHVGPEIADIRYMFANKAYTDLYRIGEDVIGRSHYDVFATLIADRPDFYEQNSAVIAGVGKASRGMDSFLGVEFAWHIFPLSVDGDVRAVVFEITPDRMVSDA